MIASGYDFYSTPRLSPDGSRLCWLSWRHPQMPWDGTELWVATITAAGTLDNPELVAGGPHESIYQPGWSPDGTLYFASDRTGWWLLYRVRRSARAIRSAAGAVASRSTRRSSGGRSGCLAGPRGHLPMSGAWSPPTRAGTLDACHDRSPRQERSPTCATDLEPLEWLTATRDARRLCRRLPDRSACRRADEPRHRRDRMLRSSSTLSLDPATVSIPEAIEFPTEGGVTAHAFYYPPRNAETSRAAVRAPSAHRNQPRRADRRRRRPCSISQVQFWTSRGFAVVDVNYGGSTGLRPRVSPAAQRAVGHRRCRRQHQRGAVSGRSRERRIPIGSSSAAAAPAATRRSRR